MSVNQIFSEEDNFLPFESVDKFLEKVRELEIENIEIDAGLTFGDKTIYLNSKDSPISYIDSNEFYKMVSINGQFYKSNKKQIDTAINQIIRNSNSNRINIRSTVLINDDLLDCLKNSSNLTEITLGSHNDETEFDQKLYQLFKDTGKSIITTGVSEDFKDNFEQVVGYNNQRKLVGPYTYSSLQLIHDLYISSPLSLEELDNLKYLNADASVIINVSNASNIFEIIKALQSYNPNREITIKMDNVTKNEFNELLLANQSIINNAINVVLGSINFIPLKDYYKHESTLIQMIEPVKNLSPYEKYLYAYNIVKQFKPYLESTNREEARNLYSVLKSDYIVCAGFANLLKDLLDKLGIKSFYYGAAVNTGLDNVANQDIVLNDDVEMHKVSHARLIVSLVDEKYGIDGIYEADPTWDNNLQNDYYNHALMTAKETTMKNRYDFYAPFSLEEVLFAENQEHFYKHLNKYSDYKKQENLPCNSQHVFISLLNLIKELNDKLYEELSDRCYSITEEEACRRIEIISNYIISKNNNSIGVDKIKEALRVLYSKFYGYESKEQVDEAVAKTISLNAKRQAISFPKRYKINQDGSQEIYIDETEKFGSIKR